MTEPEEPAHRRPADEDFWPWATAHYARPGVSQRLIELQDGAGLNVNILLWCCWSATRFHEIDSLALRHAAEAVSGWQRHVTRPLREARRYLKTRESESIEARALRDAIKGLELDAEKVEIVRLESLAQRMLTPLADGDSVARARRNLAAYAGFAGAAQTPGFSTGLLHQLIDNIFGDGVDGDA